MTAQPATHPRTTHRLTRPDAELHYEVRGAGPLLLVVGQPMTSGPFAPLADELADAYTVVTYDPRGVGLSTVADRGADVTPEAEADDLAAIIEAAGGGPADVFGTSGGAVAGLALVARHPAAVRTLVAHEPALTGLVPDAAHIDAVIDRVEASYRDAGAGAAWGGFVSLVMHDGLVGPDGVPPAAWPPPGAHGGDEDGQPVEDVTPAGGPGEDAAAPDEAPDEAADDGPVADQGRDDEIFFLRMLKPFTRWLPPVDAVRAHGGVVIAVGDASRGEIARRSADVLAERLGVTPVPLPGGHGGFMGDAVAFAEALRPLLTRTP